MGLIKAAVEAVGSTLHDQWKDYIRCEDLGQDVLMRRVSTPNGVISKDSAIQVAPGQIAVIFDSGRIVDATAEQGIYTFDQSTSPSFFAGQFGPVFKEMWTRFVYNGATNKEQAVFYLNAKEIMDNKFGTPAPIPFQDWSHPIPNQMTGTMSPLRVEVKCFGKYTFKIADPAVFMSKVAGTTDEFRKDAIVEQNTEYKLEFYVKNWGAATYPTQGLHVGIRDMASATIWDNIDGGIVITDANGSYKKYTYTFNTKGLEDVRVAFFTPSISGGGLGGFHIDKVNLEKVDKNLLANSSFENGGVGMGVYEDTATNWTTMSYAGVLNEPQNARTGNHMANIPYAFDGFVVIFNCLACYCRYCLYELNNCNNRAS